MTGKRRATFLLNQLFPLGKITLTPDGNRRTEHEPQIQCYGYAPPQWRHAVTVATFRHQTGGALGKYSGPVPGCQGDDFMPRIEAVLIAINNWFRICWRLSLPLPMPGPRCRLTALSSSTA